MPGRRAVAPRWTVDDVTYDPESHTSRLPDGTDVPHVTHVLRSVRVSEDFDDLAARGGRRGASIRLAGARGTAVHADCHAYDDDDLDWAAVDERVRPYVEAWAECRERLRLRPLSRERRLLHPAYLYTGIMDGLFEALSDGWRVLGDIKTGDPAAAAGHLQTAAYKSALQAVEQERVDQRWAIVLQPRRRVPYAIVNYDDVRAYPDCHAHAAKWQACLTVYREQQRRRVA